MEIYLYKARKIGTKKIVKSEGQFKSVEHAHEYLIGNHMVPLMVTKKTRLTTDLKELSLFQPKIKTQDIVFFCRQLGVMLGAGISIREALHILTTQVPNVSLRKKVKAIDQDVQKGNSLSDAMAKHGEFPNLLISMIKGGEAAGMVDRVMGKMATYYEKQLSFKREFKKALTYPAIVLATVVLVIPVLMIFVVPGFVEIFNDTGVQLPMATRIVMRISQWIRKRWYILIIGNMLAITGLMIVGKSKPGKAFFGQIVLKTPLIGDLTKNIMSALFGEVLSLLLTAGIPMFQSLEIVGQVLQNSVAKEEIEDALKNIQAGSTLSRSLETSTIYPPMMVSMIRIGEETGVLDEMLEKTACYYNKEVEVAVDQLTVLVEPILILIIAFLIGGIMMAVVLPTFTLATDLM